jgi:hypothetical protein
MDWAIIPVLTRLAPLVCAFLLIGALAACGKSVEPPVPPPHVADPRVTSYIAEMNQHAHEVVSPEQLIIGQGQLTCAYAGPREGLVQSLTSTPGNPPISRMDVAVAALEHAFCPGRTWVQSSCRSGTSRTGPYDTLDGCRDGQEAVVSGIVGPATFRLADGRYVRLGGLAVRPVGTCEGQQALARTTSLIHEGQTVNLVYEAGADKDEKGFTWVYIQYGEGYQSDLGAALANGYAEPTPVGANLTYFAQIAASAASFQNSHTGMWGPTCAAPPPICPAIDPAPGAAYDGLRACRQGHLVAVAKILDAATFQLADGTHVRLGGIAVQAPTSCGGQEALAKSREQVAEGRMVNVLTEPNMGADQFGNTWVYLQVGSGFATDLGYYLINAGLAEALPQGANPTYVQKMGSLTQVNRDALRGQFGPPCSASPPPQVAPAPAPHADLYVDPDPDPDTHPGDHRKSRFCGRHWYC